MMIANISFGRRRKTDETIQRFTRRRKTLPRVRVLQKRSRKHATLSSNHSPHLKWDDVPPATKSFALICHDVDVPSKPDDLFKEDREIPASLPRVDFYHWVLVDIPPTQRVIDAGSYSKEVKPRGKNGPAAPNNTRQGLNGYTDWFASDHDMNGDYFGYDGPCPPWNDSIVHRYVLTCTRSMSRACLSRAVHRARRAESD